MRAVLFAGLLSMILQSSAESTEIDVNLLKCLVCRKTMKEIDDAVIKSSPNVIVNVGRSRMDKDGNIVYKKVPQRQSEAHITEILEDVCEKMNDYARAIGKYTNRLALIKLTNDGVMNPNLGDFDIIRDGDLNKSVLYYCGILLEDFGDDIISLYVNDETNKMEKLCKDISDICEGYDDSDTDDSGRPLHAEF